MDKIRSVLTRDEIAVFTLRALYAEYGYSQYKMSKFEEYDLYVRNKDFLVSDNIITFTDTDGRLLALKPDVTLSIIKNSKISDDKLIKAQYNENVYRISGGTNSFKELMQVGLECLGAVGDDEIAEVIFLAAKSLDSISPDNVLVISHLDVAEGILDKLGVSEFGKKRILKYLGQKNSAGILEASQDEGLSAEDAALLVSLVGAYGSPKDVIARLDRFRVDGTTSTAIDQLINLTATLEKRGIEKLIIDFSLVGDMKYYNGIAMKGFIDGIPSSIISGGQYDNLMRKMGKSARAIGFAVYLDELERLSPDKTPSQGEQNEKNT